MDLRNAQFTGFINDSITVNLSRARIFQLVLFKVRQDRFVLNSQQNILLLDIWSNRLGHDTRVRKGIEGRTSMNDPSFSV